jgi:type IV pilus assembly protein PilY1
MKKIFSYLLAIYFVVNINIAYSKSPPLGTGTGDVPANILIMLDNSGSMAWGLLDRPIDVAVDSSNNIYVLEYVKGQISVFNSSKNLQRVCANNTLGYKLYFPRHIKVYGTEIFVTDTGNSRVLVIDKDTCVLKRTINFSGIGSPLGIAVSASKIYLTFSSNYFLIMNKIWSGTVNTNNVSSFVQYWSGASNNYAANASSLSLNASETKLLFTEAYVNRPVQEVTVNGDGTLNLAYSNVSVVGTGTYCWGYCPSSNGYFAYKSGLQAAIYDSNGNIYASDYGNYRMQKFTSSRTYNSKVGTPSHLVPFNSAAGMDRDSSNNIYVADYAANKIYIFNSSLTLTSTLTGGGSDKLVGSKTRMDIAKDVIKKIVSSTELTAGANFGLMEWGYPIRLSTDPNAAGGLRLRVPVNNNGAKAIYSDVDKIIAEGSTYLDSALNLAKTYFNSGTSQSVNNIFHSSPIDRNALCQLNYLIVISDGEWVNHTNVLSIADSLNKQTPSIKTFAVGFALGTTSTNYTQLADKGGTSVPLYADNETELLENLTSAISQILSARLTFTSPVPVSQTDGEFIYQSTFVYASNKQWEGNLKKYRFENSAVTGDYIWDAAEKLNAKSASSRNIWTVGLTTSSLNNFTTTYNTELQAKFSSSMITNTSLADKLINFVRGVDTYDQDADGNVTEERYKLNDIYHSQPVVVSRPKAIDTNRSYVNIYSDYYYKIHKNYNGFVGGVSCGGPCASRSEVLLAGSNGGMLHAFDTTTGEELWGFIPPSVLNKLPKMISSTANYTNSIYSVDGTTVVKDIFYNNSWKTVSITGLGRGGNSYFALDLTNPASPRHLFTIENDDLNKMVHFWDSSGNKTSHLYGGIASNKDYSKLGEAWSAPKVVRVRISGVDKWVAVFGGGFNGGSNPNLGSVVYVMDLENVGDILKKIDIADNAVNGIANSIPADLTVITANGTDLAEYYGAMVYAADYEGKLTKINLTSNGTMYDQVQLFDAETTTTNGRYIFFGPEPGIVAGNVWLYFGTGDMQHIQEQTSLVQNRMYGIKDINFPNFVIPSTLGTIAQCKKTNSPNGICPKDADLGWYVDLENYQKVTAQPTISSNNESVYFSIYEPSTGASICQAGDAILKANTTNCGDTILSQKVGKGVLTKAVTTGNNIVVGISGTADVSSSNNTLSSKDNLISGKQLGNPLSLISVETWREN